MSNTTKRPEEYLKEPYSRVLIPDAESGTYTAVILEFPGCIAQGDTPQEAYERLEDAAKDWIEAALDLRQEIPFPSQSLSFGGKVLLRLPKSLHRQSAIIAEKEGVSLNQFIVSALAERVGALKLYDKLTNKLEQKIVQIVSIATPFVIDYGVVSSFAAGSAILSAPSLTSFKLNQPIEITEVDSNAGDKDYRIFPQRGCRGFNTLQ
jgi:predicted RNase H-like HicB family nuclease